MNRRQFLINATLASAAMAKGQQSQTSASSEGCSITVKDGHYSFRSPSPDGVVLENSRLGIDINGHTLWSTGASAKWRGPESKSLATGKSGYLELHFSDVNLLWIIKFRLLEDKRSALIESTLRNVGAMPLKLGRCRVVDVSNSDGRLELGADSDSPVWLVMSGSQKPSRVRRMEHSQPAASSKVITQICGSPTNSSIHLGFLTFDRINTEHEYWITGSRRLSGSSFCDFKGFVLRPGNSIDSEQLLLQINENPHDGLSRWADLVNAHYQPRIWEKPVTGWVGWAWADPLTVERYEDVVHRNGQMVRDRLPGFEIDYLWVSIGNLKGTLPGNWLNWNDQLFPSGPHALIEYEKGLKFQPGLWIGAFWIASRIEDLVEQLQGAFLLHNGKPILISQNQWGECYVLDPTHPKTLAFLQTVLTTYREWGVRYYMIDFLSFIAGMTLGAPPASMPDGYYDQKMIPGPQAFREGLRLIREASEADTYLVAGTGPTFHCIGLMDAVRVGDDHGEGRPLNKGGKALYPATFGINKPSFWASDLQATNALASHSYMHRKLFLVDSGNVMTVDKPMPLPEAQRSATLFGINGGPIMLGDDFGQLDDERLHLVKKVFPRLPECARAIDLFETPEPDYPKIFHLPVRTKWDDWELVAVFNYEMNGINRDIELNRLSLNATQSYMVWDFWNERYLGIFSGKIPVQIASGAVSLVRIARARDYPWPLSTDLHVRQGQAEIENAHWDPTNMTLTVRALRPDGERGSLFLRIPKGYAFKDPTGLAVAKDENDGCLIVRCPLQFNNGAHFQRTFFRIDNI